MIHTIIVPGVGGSEENHWQSWLQRQLISCSRVEQQHWNLPILQTWVEAFIQTAQHIEDDLQIVAHSFGCLTTIAALAEYPQIASKVKNLVLVAPANPARFNALGFSGEQQENYSGYFQQLSIQVPCHLIISENDPWLNISDAQMLAQAWKLKPINLGAVGHINVASGFGPFPVIWNYLINNTSQHISNTDDGKYFFKFAF